MIRKDKNTNKNFIHHFLITLSVIFALITSFYAFILDENVQSMLARCGAGFFSKKFNTEVSIKTFYIKPDLRIHAEDLEMKDKKDSTMFYVGTINGKLFLRELSAEPFVKDLDIDNLFVNIVTYEGSNLSNVSEVFRKNENKGGFNSLIRVGELNVNNGHVIVWNQNKKPRPQGMDYSHIDVDGIALSLSEMSFDGDTITGYLNKLSASEKSGFVLDEFSSDSMFCVSSREIDFKNLIVKTHETSLDLDLNFSYDDYKSFNKFVDSITICADIRPSQLTLSDLRFFAPTMAKMTDTLQINGLIEGEVCDFNATDFCFSFKDSTEFYGNIRMEGLPKFSETYIDATIEKMKFTYQDISEFAIPARSGKILLNDLLALSSNSVDNQTDENKFSLTEKLSLINDATLRGFYFGFPNSFNTRFILNSNIVDLKLDGAINNNTDVIPYPFYYSTILIDSLNVQKLLDLDERFMASMDVYLSGEGITKEDASVDFNIDFSRYNSMTFDSIHFDGKYMEQRLKLATDIDSEILSLKLKADADLSDSLPSFNVNLDIDNADLYKLELYKKDSISLSTKLVAKLKGDGIDNMYGDVLISNTSLSDSRGSYVMETFDLFVKNNQYNFKEIEVDCDFFDLKAEGDVNFSNIGNTFKNYVLNYYHIDKWVEKSNSNDNKSLDFYVNLVFKNTETLSRLLMPKLNVSENTTFDATFSQNNLNFTFKSNKITYNDIALNDIQIKNKTIGNNLLINANLKEVILKEMNQGKLILGMDNLAFKFDIHSDSLLMDMSWNNYKNEDKNKGKLNATFLHEGKNAGKLYLSSSDVFINDTLWNISKDCYVEYNNKKISFNDMRIFSNNQVIGVDGYFPKQSNDTLSLYFKELDVSNFDILLEGAGINLDGIIDGDIMIAGIKEDITLSSNLNIDKIGVSGYKIGDASFYAHWNPADTSICVNTKITRNDRDTMLNLSGNYYTKRDNDNLNFYLNMSDMDISVINAFAKGTLSRIEGNLSGNFNIDGSLKKPVFTGEAQLSDAACQIDYLNTYYKVNPSNVIDTLKPYIISRENIIEVADIVLVDSSNHRAIASGFITHDYLKKFNFDINATMYDFLAMNMPVDDKASFYGTVVANGDLKITGPLKNINMNINATTKPGTVLSIGLESASSLNDNFIVFAQNENVLDTTAHKNDKNKKFNLNLNADVTPEASVNIILPSNMGNINAQGSGNIDLGYNYTDGLTLKGNYLIDKGTFKFKFQNLVGMDLNIRNGGSISWADKGKVSDADINIVGSYKAKSSISSLGLEMDSTSVVNNIDVDCLIRLQEKLSNPAITFSLELPNQTDDVKNTVFSVIDTTNQAVMAQQVISLLILGSFSYSNSSLYNTGTVNYYNILTSSISSWLSQISKDLDIGVRYTPEGILTSEEFEVALSTQLFNDRLTIEGNLGMFTDSRNQADGVSNFVGDVDLTWKVTNRLSLKMYNHSNLNSNYYTYSYEAYSPYTQGFGVLYSQSFDNIKELFTRSKKKKNNDKNNDNNKNNKKKNNDGGDNTETN